MDYEKVDIKQLEAFEMWVWRRMEKISWIEHVKTIRCLKGPGKKDLWPLKLMVIRRKWIGHNLREDSLLITIIEGRTEGEDKRPNCCWIG